MSNRADFVVGTAWTVNCVAFGFFESLMTKKAEVSKLNEDCYVNPMGYRYCF